MTAAQPQTLSSVRHRLASEPRPAPLLEQLEERAGVHGGGSEELRQAGDPVTGDGQITQHD